jgi:hypothetical protein
MKRFALLFLLVLPAIAVLPPAKTISVQWDYPWSRTNLVFEVWQADSLEETDVLEGGSLTPAWTHAGDTPDLAWSDSGTAPQRFFKVRARDTSTGFVSDWAK